MKRKQIITVGIIAIIIISATYISILNYNSWNEYNEINLNTTVSEKIDNDKTTTEPTQAVHGQIMVLVNVSESNSWMYPQNSTIEQLVSFGYKEVEVSDETFEDYPFIKEILEPKYMTTKAVTGKEKEIFFEKFYGVTFRYKDNNYVIDCILN
ncbi:hypothetical protein [Methanoplanus limicola]|uniref:Uncharacterized protein n=1 Tax=Methanoplanus limicola DSM 2279 TaxID=937775 RepID=H1YWN4_9EURY|nr:hypothetical protein [Methanoplanus limicola]EHQ36775.1 hypothetical protein Metlim_2740 [Methanoplanus limicola DSM 2279]